MKVVNVVNLVLTIVVFSISARGAYAQGLPSENELSRHFYDMLHKSQSPNPKYLQGASSWACELIFMNWGETTHGRSILELNNLGGIISITDGILRPGDRPFLELPPMKTRQNGSIWARIDRPESPYTWRNQLTSYNEDTIIISTVVVDDIGGREWQDLPHYKNNPRWGITRIIVCGRRDSSNDKSVAQEQASQHIRVQTTIIRRTRR
jgi:hypothetical protein